jgi:hypothetical protein
MAGAQSRIAAGAEPKVQTSGSTTRRRKLNAQTAAYLATHPKVKRAKEQAYRARRLAAAGSFTGADGFR